MRIHTGAAANESAAAMSANAFTFGQDIYFSAGSYNPSTRAGVHLLAHELTHTIQQSGAGPQASGSAPVSSPADPEELEAERVADTVAQDGAREVMLSTGSAVVQRDADVDAISGAGKVAAGPGTPAPGVKNAMRGPGLIDQTPPKPGDDTIRFETVLLSTDHQFVRFQLEQMIAWAGFGEAVGFMTRLAVSPLPDERAWPAPGVTGSD